MQENRKLNNFVRVSSQSSKINNPLPQKQSNNKNLPPQTAITFQPYHQDPVIDLK